MIEVKHNKKYLRQISYVVLGVWIAVFILGIISGIFGFMSLIVKDDDYIRNTVMFFLFMIGLFTYSIIEGLNQYKEDKVKYKFSDEGLIIKKPFNKEEVILLKDFKKLSYSTQMIVVGGPKMGYTCSDGYRISFKKTKTPVIEIYKDYHENYEQFEEWCREHGFLEKMGHEKI